MRATRVRGAHPLADRVRRAQAVSPRRLFFTFHLLHARAFICRKGQPTTESKPPERRTAIRRCSERFERGDLTLAVVTPLAPERYKLQVTLTRETHEKLRRAQALALHAVPDGDLGSILDRALTLLIDHLERRRFARVASPRPGPARTAWRRHIPAAVRREVWQRDEGRCAFIGRTGRCRESAFLEFHHVAPYAAGGAATADNIQLRCRAHNQYEARLFFGQSFVRERREVWTRAGSSDDERMSRLAKKTVRVVVWSSGRSSDRTAVSDSRRSGAQAISSDPDGSLMIRDATSALASPPSRCHPHLIHIYMTQT